MQLGDIIYHKLTGQKLIVIEDIEDDYELEENETVECRYQDTKGIYHSEEFYGCEIVEKEPVTLKKNKAGGCGGNCQCE